MATLNPDSLEQPLEPMKNKKWVLRVSLHCEGCKKKVKKILSQVPGVHETEFDIKQKKVTVTGDVEADALLKRLKKYGKHAVLLPENFLPENNAGKFKEQEKLLPRLESTQEETSRNAVATHDNPVTPSPAAKAEAETPQEPPPSKDSQVDGNSGTAGAQPKPESGVIPKVTPQDAKTQSDDTVEKDTKSDVNTPATSSAVGEPPTEDKDGDGNDGDKVSSDGKVESSNTSKKNKNKGQNGNTAFDDPPLMAATADRGLQDHEADPQVPFIPANHMDPRQHGYYGYQSNFYDPPHVQAVSYNVAYPSSNHTASYYSAPPPSSYVYSYYAPEAEPLPSDVESYPREPLDSFEMFSDENPNGCLIM